MVTPLNAMFAACGGDDVPDQVFECEVVAGVPVSLLFKLALICSTM